MKKYFIAAVAFVLFSTAHATTTVDSSVKDSNVHEETYTTKDGAETYTTTIYRSTDKANEVQSSGGTYHEANSGDAYYKEVVTGTDGYHSSFEEKYTNASDVKNGANMYVSHNENSYMRDESEHNPETMRDTAQFVGSHYKEDVSDINGTYKENIYGDSTWKSSFSEPGYSESIKGQSVWDSDVTIAKDYYESNLSKSDMYEESVTEGAYHSDYFESSHYKEHVADSSKSYDEDIYGESIVKTYETDGKTTTSIYGESVWDSDVHKDMTTWISNLHKSDTYKESVTAEDYESSFSNTDVHDEHLAQNL